MKQYYEALFLSYRPRTECSFSQYSIQIALIQYSGLSKHAWAFSKTVKKFPKSPIRRRFSLLQCELWSSVWMNIIRVTLQHNKELIMFFLMVLSMCNLQKRLIRAAFWVLLQAMLTNDWKQTVPRLKLQETLLTINKGNIIRWNIYRDNNFHSRRQELKRP